MSNNKFNVGDMVIVKAGCYAPVTYSLDGNPIRHTLGDVVESHETFCAVRFIGYPNIVDMTNREIEIYRRLV